MNFIVLGGRMGTDYQTHNMFHLNVFFVFNAGPYHVKLVLQTCKQVLIHDKYLITLFIRGFTSLLTRSYYEG